MEPTDQLQIVIQYFVEVSALFSCFCQYHRQMQGYHANVEASHKYRFSPSNAGCIPPCSYQGDRNALQPMGEMILPYFLYILAT